MRATNYAARALALSGKAAGQVMKHKNTPKGGATNWRHELLEEIGEYLEDTRKEAPPDD